MPFFEDLGRDFTGPILLQVKFSAGTQISGDPQCIDIYTIDDDDYEEDDQFSVELDIISTDPPTVPGSIESITVTIQDNIGKKNHII